MALKPFGRLYPSIPHLPGSQFAAGDMVLSPEKLAMLGLSGRRLSPGGRLVVTEKLERRAGRQFSFEFWLGGSAFLLAALVAAAAADLLALSYYGLVYTYDLLLVLALAAGFEGLWRMWKKLYPREDPDPREIGVLSPAAVAGLEGEGDEK